MNWRFWLKWLSGNVLWLTAAPAIYGFGLSRYVQWEYSTGARTSTDGDSLGIPIAGFIILNFQLTIAFNLLWGLYALYKKRRSA